MRRYLRLSKSVGVILLLISIAFSCKKNAVNNTPVVTTPTQPVTPPTDTTTYTLSWSDEFNGTSVDTSKWNIDTGNPNVNQEEEYYQAANATVANGNLVITAKQQQVGNWPYTSAKMNSANKVLPQYGRIEARIKLPIVVGLWPAFWMLGVDIYTGTEWPGCGEIDIMEHVNADSLIYGTMHWSAGGNQASYGLTTTTSPSAYHIYAVDWDTNSIRWYVDNKLYVKGNIANNINSTDAFHKPFFIILNLAVAGDFPGQTVDLGKLPASMYVDYVRVYTAN